MKIHNNKRPHQHGSVLMIALLTCAILGVTLASYLIMSGTQNRSVMRSQTWNSAISVTEAGIEDGLQLINKNAGNFEMLTNWPATASSDNWEQDGMVYHMRRYLGINYYDVWVTNYPPPNNLYPTVAAIGYVGWTYHIASMPSMFAVSGPSSPNQQQDRTPPNVTRKVEIRTKIDPIFNVAMAANKTIDFNGRNVETDSFDSKDPNHSTNGAYDPSKAKDNGDVVTNDVLTNSLTVGNAKIKGRVKTGPKGTIKLNNGSVGDSAWVDGGNTGIQAGHASDDMNVVFPSPTLPTGSWFTPARVATVIDGVTYDYVFAASGMYRMNTLGSGNYKMYVAPGADVKLWVYSDIYMSGQDTIRIATNASLKIYMSGATARFGGNGVVNENGDAASFYYFGLASNTSVNFSGNASFTGVIYAPTAAFELGGGGSTVYDFVGASVTKSVRMNGHFRFHYDENLKNNGMGRGFIPTGWRES